MIKIRYQRSKQFTGYFIIFLLPKIERDIDRVQLSERELIQQENLHFSGWGSFILVIVRNFFSAVVS